MVSVKREKERLNNKPNFSQDMSSYPGSSGLPGSDGGHGTPARFPPLGHPESGNFLVARE